MQTSFFLLNEENQNECLKQYNDLIEMQTYLQYLSHIPFSDTNKMIYGEFIQTYKQLIEIKKREEEEMKKQEQKQQRQINKQSSTPNIGHGGKLSNLNFGG